MILGGALGTLYDRIFFKAVPDFIDFHIGNFHWFIFNVSDIFISLGVLFLITLELINNQKGKFNELPIPDNNQKSENNEETDIKKLITNNENSSTENSSNQNTNFENSILEKIKNN